MKFYFWEKSTAATGLLSGGELTREMLIVASVVAYLFGLFTPTIKSFFTSITGEIGRSVVRSRIESREETKQWYYDVNSTGRQVVTQLYPESRYDDRLETTIENLEELTHSPPNNVDPEYVSLARELRNTYREGKRQPRHNGGELPKHYESEVVRTAMDLVLKTRDELDEGNSLSVSELIGRER